LNQFSKENMDLYSASSWTHL